MALFLDIPYAEKDNAKFLGAKWNPKVKKWYVDTDKNEYIKFAKWILNNTDDAIIAYEYVYIIEGEQICWKCHRNTKVIGLGIADFINIYGEPDNPQIDFFDDDLHLAWVDQENDVPFKLLQYLKENYPVKMGYSKTLEDKCFANHCSFCGALQGNYFLFDEPTSPFSPDVEDKQLEKKMSKLNIYGIPIEDDLLLNWNLVFCDNDYAYFKYGQFKELVLSSDPENEYIPYMELYNI